MPLQFPEGPRRALETAHIMVRDSPEMTEAPRGRNRRWPSADPAPSPGGDATRARASRAGAGRPPHVSRASVVANMVFEKSENSHSRALVEELNQL